MRVGIIGGTGPAGRGLGLRLAQAGHSVLLGSREPERGEQIAGELSALWEKQLTRGAVGGSSNNEAARQDVVVVATPADHAVRVVRTIRDDLAGKTVISMVNALVKEAGEMRPLIHPRGSMALAIQAECPTARVVGALHHVPAGPMEALDQPIDVQTIICADDALGLDEASSLLESVPGMRVMVAGSLAQAGALEAFTAVCISINMRYRMHSAIEVRSI